MAPDLGPGLATRVPHLLALSLLCPHPHSALPLCPQPPPHRACGPRAAAAAGPSVAACMSHRMAGAWGTPLNCASLTGCEGHSLGRCTLISRPTLPPEHVRAREVQAAQGHTAQPGRTGREPHPLQGRGRCLGRSLPCHTQQDPAPGACSLQDTGPGGDPISMTLLCPPELPGPAAMSPSPPRQSAPSLSLCQLLHKHQHS